MTTGWGLKQWLWCWQWELGAVLSLVWLIRALLQVKLRSLKRQADELRAVPSLQFLVLGSSGSPGPCLLQPVIYNSPLEQWMEAQPSGQHWHTMHGNETHRMTHCHTHTCSHTPTLTTDAVLRIITEFLSLFCLASKSKITDSITLGEKNKRVLVTLT